MFSAFSYLVVPGRILHTIVVSLRGRHPYLVISTGNHPDFTDSIGSAVCKPQPQRLGFAFTQDQLLVIYKIDQQLVGSFYYVYCEQNVGGIGRVLSLSCGVLKSFAAGSKRLGARKEGEKIVSSMGDGEFCRTRRFHDNRDL